MYQIRYDTDMHSVLTDEHQLIQSLIIIFEDYLSC
jgi:hypothetical protein